MYGISGFLSNVSSVRFCFIALPQQSAKRLLLYRLLCVRNSSNDSVSLLCSKLFALFSDWKCFCEKNCCRLFRKVLKWPQAMDQFSCVCVCVCVCLSVCVCVCVSSRNKLECSRNAASLSNTSKPAASKGRI